MITLRGRYANLYIPSDFFNARFRWTEAFPLHRPFNITAHSCDYHVMHKEVEPLEKSDAIIDPPDADHLFSAKVRFRGFLRTCYLFCSLDERVEVDRCLSCVALGSETMDHLSQFLCVVQESHYL